MLRIRAMRNRKNGGLAKKGMILFMSRKIHWRRIPVGNKEENDIFIRNKCTCEFRDMHMNLCA